MASREELYAKFGITAEAAQLLETDLNTLVLASHGLEKGWHIRPDPATARKIFDEINSHTLGQLLGGLKRNVTLDDVLVDKFSSALRARNRLIHGWYESHNFKIQTDEGRDEMIADLDVLHEELFQAWQMAAALVHCVGEFMRNCVEVHDPDQGGPITSLAFLWRVPD